ncbi:efflux RND transporter permease subunit [Brevibacillus agri]|uniref:efflux RND transporter permease subunit n=1 Tax=Brevibacillus agri TaxID=51101 RepID=UPI002E1D77CC|nr:efflux RND transporter permease subunit [Brevibacillus agri]MED4569813.1 efflux RND transporter permease subunit [Brevibacillus agri]
MNNKAVLSIAPALARLIAVLLCLFAISALFRMDVQTFSDRGLPEYNINLIAPGLTADQVEASVTRKVEEAVRAMGSAVMISTDSRPGAGTITVQTAENLGSDYKERLEQKLSQVAKTLPVQEYSISQEKLGDSLVGFYLLHGSDVQTLSNVARYTVYEKLIQTPGVARVEVDGQPVREQIEVVFRPSMLLVYGLTPGDVLNQLPSDVIGEEIGTVGKTADRTAFTWTSQTEGPQGLGKQLIATGKGYVPLSLLADIRDTRGSKGEEVSVYRGSPAVGISVYAAEVGQIPSIRKEIANMVAELNEEAAGKHELDLFEDHALPISAATGQLALLAGLAVLLCALFLFASLKRTGPAVLSLLAVFMAAGGVLGGMWLFGLKLTFFTLGPLLVFTIVYLIAGVAFFSRLDRLGAYSFSGSLKTAWTVMKPLLLALVVMAAAWFTVVMTDMLKAEDKVVLFDAWPVLVLGAASLALVYGWVVPVLAGTWLTARETPADESSPRAPGRLTRTLVARWERLVQQGYLPFGLTLVSSVVFVLFLQSFVLVEPFRDVKPNGKTLSLPMVQESTVDDAIKAAQTAEERLRGLAEVADLYTVASRERLTMHLKLTDKADWTRSVLDLEKELDKKLRDIPQTDPFALVVNEEQKTRLEFTVKGPSQETANHIAKEILEYLQQMRWRDNDGREIVTDERIGPKPQTALIDIRPKAEMLARYHLSEEEIKRQLESYLGEKRAGSIHVNERNVSVVARFPDKWMDHPEQVKQILIRTQQGPVRLADLVDWSSGGQPQVYERQDGMYVVKVSSAIADPRWIDNLAYNLPLVMQEKINVPEGYTILNEDELKKLSEEQSDKKDWSGRFIVMIAMVAVVLMASLLLRRRTRDGWFALILLPVLSGGVTLGLLLLDHPMNVMGFYGIAAAAALLISLALLHLDELSAAHDEQPSIWEGVRVGAKRAWAAQAGVAAAVAIACLPVVGRWMAGGESFASFASSLLFGTVFASFVTLVLVPGMQHAAQWRENVQSDLSLPVLVRRLRDWQDNERIRRRDLREVKRRQKQLANELRKEQQDSSANSKKALSQEDFLPLPTGTDDAKP